MLDERPMVRIRRIGGGNANGIAALIPSETFIAPISSHGTSTMVRAQIKTGDGVLVIGSGSSLSHEDPEEWVSATVRSQRYPLVASTLVPLASAGISRTDLRAFETIATGLLAIVILLLSLVLGRRVRVNPVAEIAQAIKAREFVPYYHPVVDIRSGRLLGAEVLARWRRPDGTVASPASFIPLAESSGLIIELTRDLMQQACKEIGPAMAKRPHLKVSFNLTAQHFADEQIVMDVRRIFGKSPLRLSQVVFEMTERQPLEDLTETRRVIASLQGLGVRIAIDDVGTGHGGLSYMLKLGVDIIKIDKMFVDALGSDRYSNTIVETLIDLAHNMRMQVIAEGVENFEQVVQLREIGIRAAQGYVFAPPLPGSAFLKLTEALDPIKKADSAAAAGAMPKRRSA